MHRPVSCRLDSNIELHFMFISETSFVVCLSLLPLHLTSRQHVWQWFYLVLLQFSLVHVFHRLSYLIAGVGTFLVVVEIASGTSAYRLCRFLQRTFEDFDGW